MKYRCLILDHDDTCVDSTAEVHYPAHLEVMRRIRPETPTVSLETWFEKNFDPGIMEFLTGELAFTPEELELEYEIWRDFTLNRTPGFFPGIPELLRDFRRQGGVISVVSHSDVDVIRRFYEAAAPDLMPELIFGWDSDPEKRKPRPWPAEETLRRLDLEPGEALLVDDLRPGIEMAARTGIPAAAAGWGHRIPRIQKYMRENCLVWLASVNELREFLEL